MRLSIIVSIVFSFAITSCLAANLGQITINDPVSGSLTLIYEEQHGYALIEGDIIIGKITELKKNTAVIRSKIGGSRWPQGVVPFELAESLPIMSKLAVLQAISHWQQHTFIEFVELTSKNRSQYPDYITFIPASGRTCSSYVGRQGGQQIIQLAPRCNTMNTVHEIGHALGLWHEQSRSDRDNYIRIVWENIDEDHKHNFEQHVMDGKDFGDYDYHSIMHYSSFAFSKNGKETIIPLMEGIRIGQREYLSEKDKAAIAAMYPEV